MTKTTYRVIPRKKGKACDVEATEPGAAPRIVNTFNTEAEAWDWVHDQQMAAEFAARHPHAPKKS